jgi:tetratricopeptide (TPR) repeat protein
MFMKKAVFLVTILCLSVFSTACINNFAVQELNNKAMEYMKKGDFENAISRLKSSVDLDESIFESQYNLAVAYTEAEDYEHAIEVFKKAIELNPEFADVYYSYAIAQENYAKAILAGTSMKQKEAQAEMDIDLDSETAVEKEYKPTDAEKAEAESLYQGAIQAYETYLEKGKDVKDAVDVKDKVELLKIDVEKLSTDEVEQ